MAAMSAAGKPLTSAQGAAVTSEEGEKLKRAEEGVEEVAEGEEEGRRDRADGNRREKNVRKSSTESLRGVDVDKSEPLDSSQSDKRTKGFRALYEAAYSSSPNQMIDARFNLRASTCSTQMTGSP